jgi:hypothetical protein
MRHHRVQAPSALLFHEAGSLVHRLPIGSTVQVDPSRVRDTAWHRVPGVSTSDGEYIREVPRVPAVTTDTVRTWNVAVTAEGECQL